jgi:hypothetical protein
VRESNRRECLRRQGYELKIGTPVSLNVREQPDKEAFSGGEIGICRRVCRHDETSILAAGVSERRAHICRSVRLK